MLSHDSINYNKKPHDIDITSKMATTTVLIPVPCKAVCDMMGMRLSIVLQGKEAVKFPVVNTF